jgi:hypothetical protein
MRGIADNLFLAELVRSVTVEKSHCVMLRHPVLPNPPQTNATAHVVRGGSL